MEYSYFEDNNDIICEDCTKIHDIDNIHYCPYHNECFKFEHKLCERCYECLIFKDGYTDKYLDSRKAYKTCSECLSKQENFEIINYPCKLCEKEHNKDKKYYCPIENECFIYKHDYCSIDERCKSELDFHCLECNKCHNIVQTIYCLGCNYCFDYKHKLCTNCNKCISISGKKNTNKTICEQCEYNINTIISNNINKTSIRPDIKKIKCERTNIVSLEQIDKQLNKKNKYCVKCNKYHEIDKKYIYCNDCNECYDNIECIKHTKFKYCMKCDKYHEIYKCDKYYYCMKCDKYHEIDKIYKHCITCNICYLDKCLCNKDYCDKCKKYYNNIKDFEHINKCNKYYYCDNCWRTYEVLNPCTCKYQYNDYFS